MRGRGCCPSLRSPCKPAREVLGDAGRDMATRGRGRNGSWAVGARGPVLGRQGASAVSCVEMDRRNREGNAVLNIAIEICIGAFALGMFVGILIGYRMAEGRQLRMGRKGDMDRLIAQFQGLFRQIDQEKQQRP